MSTTAVNTMRAITQETYGDAETWRMSERARPEIAPGEVLIRVQAAGLDRGTWHMMTGLPYLGRLAFGLTKPKQQVPGFDLAGTVAEIGAGVTRFAPGDEVYGIGRGSFAEYAVAREDKLARRPANLTVEQASVVPVSGLTAIQSVRDSGRVTAGQRVLIVGASGGVGSFAVQIAKAAGAHVTGVCSTAKTDFVRSLGADDVIDYTAADFSEGNPMYDVILDIGGNSTLSRLRRALAPKGTLVIVGGEDGGKLSGGMNRQFRVLALSMAVGQRLTMKLPKENFADLEALTVLIEAGSVTPSVEMSYPLEQAADAMRHLAAGQARGKIAITI